MRPSARDVLVVAVLAAVAAGPGTGAVRGQGLPTQLPPMPVPVTPPTQGTTGQASQPSARLPGQPDPIWVDPQATPPSGLPAGPAPPQPPPPPPLYAVPDPGQNGWGAYGQPSPAPGPYFSLELDVVKPVLRDRINNFTPIPTTGATVNIPSAGLPWTVAPWFELGYRLPESWGYLATSYRFFNVAGSGSIVEHGIPSPLHTRVVVNMADLDYGSTPFSFAPRWTWAWRVGVRYANVFFDSRFQNPALREQTSESYSAFGPHMRLDLSRYFDPVPGLSLLTRADGAVVLGRSTQKFRQTVVNPDGTQRFGMIEQNGQQAVPILIAQVGLSYVPPQWPNWQFTGGYMYERWWYLGQLGFDSTSSSTGNGVTNPTRGELQTQGLFLRALVCF